MRYTCTCNYKVISEVSNHEYNYATHTSIDTVHFFSKEEGMRVGYVGIRDELCH